MLVVVLESAARRAVCLTRGTRLLRVRGQPSSEQSKTSKERRLGGKKAVEGQELRAAKEEAQFGVSRAATRKPMAGRQHTAGQGGVESDGASNGERRGRNTTEEETGRRDSPSCWRVPASEAREGEREEEGRMCSDETSHDKVRAVGSGTGREREGRKAVGGSWRVVPVRCCAVLQ